MPFTLSHPAAVIATPKSKCLNHCALIIGSMSPDFVYYLFLDLPSKFGHTLIGSFVFDLPLCFIFFYLYLYFIQPYIWTYCPKALNLNTKVQPLTNANQIFIFCLSALIGIFSHILLDFLVHKNSDILVTFDFIQPYHQGLRIYRLYHLFISIIGLSLVIFYWYKQAKKQLSLPTVSLGSKLKYWVFIFIFTVIFLAILHFTIMPLSNLNNLIIAITATVFLAIVLTGIIYKVSNLMYRTANICTLLRFYLHRFHYALFAPCR